MVKVPIRILLLDDHPIFRAGLRLVLERAPGMAVVGDADAGPAALDLASRTQPDVLLADIHLPGEDGIGVAARIQAVCPAVRVVFLSSDGDPALVRRALDRGARGYLLKENAAEDVIRAVEAAVQGGLYLSPEIAGRLVRHYRERSALSETVTRRALLSARETEVLHLLVDGMRNKEIAARLQVGTKSVETYRSRLMKKLGCHSPAELVRHAVREGLVPP